MKKTLSKALIAVLVISAVGCESLGSRASLPLAPPQTIDVRPEVVTAAAPVRIPSSIDGRLLAMTLGPSPSVVPALAPCDAPSDKRGYYGFYANDPWDKGEVVLTFDDGPQPKATPRVLDLLAKEKMRATFFLIGRNISKDTYPLVQRMVAEGHTIGSHSYSHDVHMTNVRTPKETVLGIRGQHEVTSIIIDLALMAQSPDDFDSMFRQDFESDPAVWMTESAIRKNWQADLERHKTLLDERGFSDGRRPYTVLYSRPPGGGPYVEHDGAQGIALYDQALSKLGMINVLWQGASGDTVPGQSGDFAFLTGNMDRYAKHGGVILLHDHIRADALTASLNKIAKDPSLKVVPIEEAVQHKYACSSESLGLKLVNTAAADILPRGIFGVPDSHVALSAPLAVSH